MLMIKDFGVVIFGIKPQLSEVFYKTKRFLKVGRAVRMSPDFVPVPTGNERDQTKQVNKKTEQLLGFLVVI